VPLVTDVSYPSLIPVTVGKPGKRRALGKPLKRKPYQYHSVALGRKPTPLEERLLSLRTIPGELDARTAAIVGAVRMLRQQSIDVSRASLMRDLLHDTQAVLADGLDGAAQFGAAEHNLEWVRQGAALTLADDVISDAVASDRLQTFVRTRAERLIRDWREWALDTDEHLMRRQASTELWQQLVLRRIDTGLWQTARGIINVGFAAGRRAERHRLISLKKVAPEILVFTAVLDKNTCDECADADGAEFEEGSPEEDEYDVPYALCEGGVNCRCMIVAVGSEPGWVNAAIDHLAILHLVGDHEAALKAWDKRGRSSQSGVVDWGEVTDQDLHDAYAEALGTGGSPEQASDWPLPDDALRSEGERYPSVVSDAYKTWIDELEYDEKNAINEYTGSGYESINRYLRTGETEEMDIESHRDEYDEWVSNQQAELRADAENEYGNDVGNRYDEITEIWNEMSHVDSPYGDVSTHPTLPGITRPPADEPQGDKVSVAQLLEDIDVSSGLSDEEKDTIRERLAGTGGPARFTTHDASKMFDRQYEEPDFEGDSYESWLTDNYPDAIGGDSSEADVHAAAITSALKRAPKPPPPELVWRAISKLYEAVKKNNLAAGDVIRMDGFQSTSIKPTFARGWGKVLFEIKPRSGAYVDPISNSSGEKEFLLPHGHKYRVRGVTTIKFVGDPETHSGQTVIQLEDLGEAA
jgi:hypothetical protein